MINWIKKNNFKILWAVIAVYIIIFSLISWWKYDLCLYNGLDLAIFNQTFYNTAHGNWFGLTIHPPSYLGDHFTPIILLLLPFYYLGQSPLNLLILQTVFLALGAWPVFKIAQKVFKKRFDMDVKIHKASNRNGKQTYRLYFSATSFRKFYDIVRPYLKYIPKDMYYKFNMKYKSTRINETDFLNYNLS